MTIALSVGLVSNLSGPTIRPFPLRVSRSPAMSDLNESICSKSLNLTHTETQSSELWLEEMRTHLEELAALGPGWNDGSAKPIEPTVISNVSNFIASELVLGAPVLPNIVPTFEGGLLIEWHTEAVDLVIEPALSGDASFYYCDNETGDEVEALLRDRIDVLGRAFIKLGCKF